MFNSDEGITYTVQHKFLQPEENRKMRKKPISLKTKELEKLPV